MCALFTRHFGPIRHRPAVVGMVHVGALPATPTSTLTVAELVRRACAEAAVYVRHGIDAVCLENMFDVPYVCATDAGPDTTAVMARVATEVRAHCPPTVPVGVQILAGHNRAALAVALAAELQFIRVEAFVFGHVADEGLMNACAGPLLRYRRQIGAHHVAILTDIKKKHCAHAITADVDIVDTAKAARFFLSDGLIVTGRETGDSADIDEVVRVRHTLPDTPLLVGSGVTPDNVGAFANSGVDAVIVGSYFKTDGQWQNEICEERVARFMKAARQSTS